MMPVKIKELHIKYTLTKPKRDKKTMTKKHNQKMIKKK